MTQRPEIIVLFNHDAAHQVAHVAGIARALGERDDVQVTCATGTPAIAARAAALIGPDARVAWLDLSLPRWKEAALALPNRLAPVKRLARLDHHAPRLRAASVIVSPERTCLRLKKRWAGSPMPAFAFVPHGAGDRSVSYHPDMANFDLILVSGPKVAREMIGHGLGTAENVVVVGYPKFDTVDLSRRERVFANDNPVLLYNPHFDPFLSSWYDEGPALLDWFAGPAGQHLNLIFAPHIMLFRKALHISPEYRVARLRPGIADAWRAAPNIRIDTGSERLVDMSYTLAADAYIGDVSSQIYEYLVHPRPAWFIDRFTHDSRSREAPLPCWAAGEVVETAAQLVPQLANTAAWPDHHAEQKTLFADTFSVDPAVPASVRAASAIGRFLTMRGIAMNR